MIEDKIAKLVEAKFKEEEWDDCFLVDIDIKGNNRVEIYIDSDEALTLQKCQRVSRHVEAVLDEELWLGEKYTIEVSSPGVSRPLKLKRQYVKNIGRKIELNLKEGKEEGKLMAVEGDEIVIEKRVKRKEGKKKINELATIRIPFDQIEQTKVKISFK